MWWPASACSINIAAIKPPVKGEFGVAQQSGLRYGFHMAPVKRFTGGELKLKLTVEQYAWLRTKAEARNMPVAQYVRGILADLMDKEVK